MVGANLHCLIYSYLGLKPGQYQQPFFYFSIAVAMPPIFGYLFEFQVDFEEHQVVLVKDFYLLRKLLLNSCNTKPNLECKHKKTM